MLSHLLLNKNGILFEFAALFLLSSHYYFRQIQFRFVEIFQSALSSDRDAQLDCFGIGKKFPWLSFKCLNCSSNYWLVASGNVIYSTM